MGPFFFPGRCNLCKRFRTPILWCASSSSLFTPGWRALPRSACGRCPFLLLFLRPCARLLLLKHFELERYKNTRCLSQKLLPAKCKINQSSFWTSRAKPRHAVQLQPFLFLLPVFSASLTRRFPWWSRWVRWSRPPGVFNEDLTYASSDPHLPEQPPFSANQCRLRCILITWLPIYSSETIGWYPRSLGSRMTMHVLIALHCGVLVERNPKWRMNSS